MESMIEATNDLIDSTNDLIDSTNDLIDSDAPSFNQQLAAAFSTYSTQLP